jgi:hypothetical protein
MTCISIKTISLIAFCALGISCERPKFQVVETRISVSLPGVNKNFSAKMTAHFNNVEDTVVVVLSDSVPDHALRVENVRLLFDAEAKRMLGVMRPDREWTIK